MSEDEEERSARLRRELRMAMCVGKVQFESRGLANQVARRRSKTNGGRPAVAYKCTGCGKYHIGQRRPGD